MDFLSHLDFLVGFVNSRGHFYRSDKRNKRKEEGFGVQNTFP
jgi:hypothetical protein